MNRFFSRPIATLKTFEGEDLDSCQSTPFETMIMTQPSRPLVLRKLRTCFPDESLANNALNLLDQYGVELHERERDRIQLAILKLSEGDLSKLQHYIQVAETDYRDVLAWAEYPEQMHADASRSNSSPEVIRAIEERDRKQYEQWLSEDSH